MDFEALQEELDGEMTIKDIDASDEVHYHELCQQFDAEVMDSAMSQLFGEYLDSVEAQLNQLAKQQQAADR
jgi:hypothetical protein